MPKTCGWSLPYTRIWLSKLEEGLAALPCLALHADHLAKRMHSVHQIRAALPSRHRQRTETATPTSRISKSTRHAKSERSGLDDTLSKPESECPSSVHHRKTLSYRPSSPLHNGTERLAFCLRWNSGNLLSNHAGFPKSGRQPPLKYENCHKLEAAPCAILNSFRKLPALLSQHITSAAMMG